MNLKIVLDTNILLSALWKRPSNPAQIVDLVAMRQLTPCYNAQILAEYSGVLNRPKFKFSSYDATNLLDLIKKDGLSLLARPSLIPFPDESDRVFYDLARENSAVLITGNTKHYPVEAFIMTPAAFLSELEKE
ncbi:MAG: putative toxin-antitoxin system toxin component, PIN family [Clostridiales bacterium]|jgi:putative PIN family toxin of toxin-antitoxin system|nr:putative toxin-antitoxin system toxin component, PIN family [Clostridiales bacterium]